MHHETRRTAKITPFRVMDVLERAVELSRQGAAIIHLEVGEPDFDTPAPVREAVCKAMADGETHYTHSLGLPELREAICAFYASRYGVRVHPDQVCVTNGTSPAMLLLFSALLEEGDEVILSNPHYACYPSFVHHAGGEPVYVRVYEEDGFQYRPEAVAEKITARTKAIFVNSPGNPTGNLLSGERMQALAQLGPPLVSDEIYHGLTYTDLCETSGGEACGEREHSALEYSDEAFVFNGFSKLHAMTGLRLGYLIAPPRYMPTIKKLCQNFFISANSVSQRAGIAALTHCEAEIEAMRRTYNERRVFMLRRLKELGFGVTVEPMGAFYVLANARHICQDSMALAFEILEQAHVGVTPGIDFGDGAEGYIRFSYANSIENIAEGLTRIERFLAARKG